MDFLSRVFPFLFSYSYNRSFVNKLRQKRHLFFLNFIQHISSLSAASVVRILDIGGTYHYWKSAGLLDHTRYHLTLLNIDAEYLPETIKGFSTVDGNAMSLDYPNNYFDIVFSNSVIEHMGSRQGQMRMAREVQRVGRSYYIQTPSKWFLLEPHCRIPFFQFLPKYFRAFLIYKFKINYFPTKSTYTECLKVSDSTIMLSYREFKSLFTEAEIIKETLFGITKSYTAVYLGSKIE